VLVALTKEELGNDGFVECLRKSVNFAGGWSLEATPNAHAVAPPRRRYWNELSWGPKKKLADARRYRLPGLEFQPQSYRFQIIATQCPIYRRTQEAKEKPKVKKRGLATLQRRESAKAIFRLILHP
jgi:hypothetical protein